MTLYFIGIGLCDEKDITLKGLEAIKRCPHVYLESYTSKLSVPVSKLEAFYSKKIIPVDRTFVEQKADEMLERARTMEVAFLVVGDIFSATTHHDLRLRAEEEGIACVFIHNASIMNAISVTGLDLYKFGRTTTLVFPEGNYFPDSPYDIIHHNLYYGMHTLVLLDIKADREEYMTVNDALQLLLELEKKKKKNVISEKMMVVGCARIGHKDAVIRYGSLKNMLDFDFGEPLHTLIILGRLHFMEEDVLKRYSL